MHPSYSLNRLARDLLPLVTMDARGETKGISIRGYTSYPLFPIQGTVGNTATIHLDTISSRVLCLFWTGSFLSAQKEFYCWIANSAQDLKCCNWGYPPAAHACSLSSVCYSFWTDFRFSLACAKGVILVLFSSLLVCAVRTPFAELPFTAKNWLGSARELGVLRGHSLHRQKGLFRDI